MPYLLHWISGSDSLFNIGQYWTGLLELVGEIEHLLGRSIDVAFKQCRQFDVPSNILSIQKAKNSLSWSPVVSISEGLSRLKNNS